MGSRSKKCESPSPIVVSPNLLSVGDFTIRESVYGNQRHFQLRPGNALIAVEPQGKGKYKIVSVRPSKNHEDLKVLIEAVEVYLQVDL